MDGWILNTLQSPGNAQLMMRARSNRMVKSLLGDFEENVVVSLFK